MELIRHCDDLWIDGDGVRWFQSCPWFPPKDTKYFMNLATSRYNVLSIIFLLVITIPNHSGLGHGSGGSVDCAGGWMEVGRGGDNFFGVLDTRECLKGTFPGTNLTPMTGPTLPNLCHKYCH